MQLPTELQPPASPMIWTSSFPQAERSAINFALDRIRAVERFASNFVYAVALCKFLSDIKTFPSDDPEEFRMLLAWRSIPCRDATMSLYHWCKTVESFKVGTDCPTFREQTDFKTIRKVRREFRERFPTIERLRHALAHAGEIDDSPEKAREHFAEFMGGKNVRLVDVMFDNKYTNTFEGVVLEVDMNAESMQFVNRLTKQFFSAFPKGEDSA